MQILMVNTLYAPHSEGGAARSVQELGEALIRLGHEVRLLTLALSAGDVATESMNGVVVRRLDSGTAARPFVGPTTQLAPVQKLAWQARENRRRRMGALVRREISAFSPDVVHTNNIAGFGIEVWRATANVPLVHTMRDYYLTCVRSQMFRRDSLCETQCLRCRLFKAPVRTVERRPAVWVGVSGDIVERHRRIGVIGVEDRSAVIYNWPEIDHALLRARPSSPGVVFGLFGRVGGDKGTWLAVEAFLRLHPDLRSKARLVIGGGASAEDRARLSSLMKREGDIEYLGGALQPETFYSSTDVVLVPSRWFEPFGRVAAEGRLAGCSVIASRLGGLPEALQAFGGAGTLVHDHDSVAAWTTAMARAIEQASPTGDMHDGVPRSPRSPRQAPPSLSEAPSVAEQYLDVYRQAGAV